MTVWELQHKLPERELAEWMLRGKPLWTRRVEILLAQVAMFIARSTGNADFELADADLFRRREPEAPQTAEMAAVVIDSMVSGAGVIVLGRGRKAEQQEGET